MRRRRGGRTTKYGAIGVVAAAAGQTAGCECVAYLPVTGEIKRKELIQPTSGAAGHDHWGHQIERRGVV